jgi:hypothetical protein
MFSPKLDVDIVLLDVADRQWSCTPLHQSAHDDDCWDSTKPWSFKFYEAQIDNKACETWLNVSDKPLSLEHLEPLKICIFLAGSL